MSFTSLKRGMDLAFGGGDIEATDGVYFNSLRCDYSSTIPNGVTSLIINAESNPHRESS